MNIIREIIQERTFIDDEGKLRTRFGYRGNNRIEWIVVHYTGTASIQGQAKVMSRRMKVWKRAVSTHYLVGDDGIYQAVEERHSAWHCGVKTGSIPKCGARNSTSIGVDLVEHKRNTRTHSVNDRDWYFTEKVFNAGAQLIAELADKYDIPQSHIVRHFDVTGKLCPRPFVGNDTNEITGDIHEIGWIMFKERVRMARRNGFPAE